MRIGWLVALGAIEMGCALSPKEPRFHGDVTFTAEERAAIERGDAWLAAQIGEEPLGVTWDLPHPDRIDDAPAYSIVRARPPRGVGEYDGELRVTINPGLLSPAGLETLAAHELGHYRGMDHHQGAEGIMHDGIRDEAPVWTAEDLAECRRVRLCR